MSQKDKILDLTEDEIASLKERGYTVQEFVGEGSTRTAYRATYEKGGARRGVVLTASKLEIDPLDSVTAAINGAKKDLDAAGVDISNRLNHPHVEQVIDHFKVGDRSLVVVPDNMRQGEVDLETLVRISGPIKDKKILQRVMTQTLDALDYLHNQDIVHRDIKPSNITISKKEGEIKVRDLQNATTRALFGMSGDSIPTRGGTRYTTGEILNSIIEGRASRYYDFGKLDMHGLGATFYYVLTGENVFDYKMVSNKEGKEIKIKDKTFQIQLLENENPISGIDLDKKERILKKKLKKVPRVYRDIIYGLMTETRNGFVTTSEARSLANKRFAPTLMARLAERSDEIIRGSKLALALGAGGGILSGAVLLVATMAYNEGANQKEKSPYSPRSGGIIDQREKRYSPSNFNMDALHGEDRLEVLNTIIPYHADLERRIAEHIDESTIREVRTLTTFGDRANGLDKRLTSAWLKACLLADKNTREAYASDGQDRIAPTYVPRAFVKLKSEESSFEHPENEKDSFKYAPGISMDFLKENMNPDGGTNVAELFASYFAGNDGVRKAIAKSQGTSYFPRYDPSTGKLKDQGYRVALPEYQRELIDEATAIYLITNEEGEIDNSLKSRIYHEWANRNLRKSSSFRATAETYRSMSTYDENATLDYNINPANGEVPK